MNKNLSLALMAGIDIPIPELKLICHPPVVREIAYMGEEDFFLAMQFLCMNKESLIQDKNILSSLTNFQVMMKVLEQSQDKEKKRSLITLLQLLFPNCTAMFTPKALILSETGTQTTTLIDDSNFDILQETTREVLCVHDIFQGDNIVYNPIDARAAEIAAKLERGRRKVAEIKGVGKNSVLTRYISVLTVGVPSLTVEQCLNMNLFQIFDLIHRYNAYVEWDIDLRVRLAGGKPDNKVETWMRDLHTKK